MNIKNEVLYRVYGVTVLFLIYGFLILGKVVKISFVEGDYWVSKSDSLYLKYEKIDAQRGNILASDGSFLATSLPYYDIRFDLNAAGLTKEIFDLHVDSLAYRLVEHVDNRYTVGGMKEMLVRERNKGQKYLLIKRNVTHEELELYKTFPIFRRGQFKGGFIYEKKAIRGKPYGMLAHRTVGYVRKDAKPVGLEGYFNDVLSGEEGKRLVQRVSNKEYMPVSDLADIQPHKGKDVKTTLDVNIQDAAQSALMRGMLKHNAQSGSAIVMDVKTGAIKAIANLGVKKDGDLWEKYNYAIGTRIEPGSVFKLASVMALFEEGYSTDTPVFIGKGKHEFYDQLMIDSGKESFLYDSLSLRKAFEISSNVGIASTISKHFGEPGSSSWRTKNAKFIAYLEQFGLDLPTNIEIEGEAVPYIKDPLDVKDEWSGTTLPWMSIGYETLFTPLQMLNFYNTVANDGKMMKPYLVSEIQEDGEWVQSFKPVVVKKKIASKETIAKAKKLLAGVVESGTANALMTKKYDFAAKTGTAQLDYSKKAERLKHRATFVGFFPVENPIYSCIVTITDPKKLGIYGGEVAGPIFREIADNCYATNVDLKKNVADFRKPIIKNDKLPVNSKGKLEDYERLNEFLDFKIEKEYKSDDWVYLKSSQDTLLLKGQDIVSNIIPNVKGMGLRDAIHVLENMGLKVIVRGTGKVYRQSIKPGTKARRQRITLNLG